MDILNEQQPIVLVCAAIVVLLLGVAIGYLNSQKSVAAEKQPVSQKKSGASKKKKSKKGKATADAAPEQPVEEEEKKAEPLKKMPEPVAQKTREIQAPAPAPPKVEEAPELAASAGKKKKKKKGAVTATAPELEPEPEPQPEPESEPEAASKKKKKKKNKKKKTNGSTEALDDDEDPAGTKKGAANGNDEDEESDEDDVALLLKNRKPKILSMAAANGKKKQQLEQQAAKRKEEAKTVEAPAPAPADPNAINTVTLKIEPQDKPVLVGPKGATIQGIQFDSNSRLDIDGSVLKITGTEAAIAVAMGQVQKILSDHKEEIRRKTACSATLTGPQVNGSDGVKAIIGKGGATIQSIQTQTGCKLDADVEKAVVKITGPSDEQVAQAAMLCKHAVFGESQHTIQLGNVGTVMLVYGKDFAKIKQMQTDSGAKLDIAKGSTTLEISGSTEAVAKAREMVQQWVDYCKGEVLMIEASKVGLVYGKSGATIRRIQERTGAIIQVDDADKKGNAMVPCQILGEPDVVAQAKELVLKALDGDVELKPGEVMEKMELDVGAPAIIGRGGSKIRELESKFGIQLVLNGSVCTVAGKKENVSNAKTEIEKLIKPLLEEKRIAAEAARLAAEAQTGDPGPWGGQFDDGADGW